MMIYQAYDLAWRATRPLTAALSYAHGTARHHRNPLGRMLVGRALSTAFELPLRNLQEYRKRPYNVATPGGSPDTFLSEQVVRSLPFADLIRFSSADPSDRPKVLIAAALSGHHATLLRDTVRGFARDFDPHITDWKDARDIPIEAGPFGLDEYIGCLIDFIRTMGPGTHLVATCQAAPAALVATAVLVERHPDLAPASLTLMAGPVDTRVNRNLINKIPDRVPLALLRRLNIHRVPSGFPGAGRRVYPGFVQLMGFVTLNPMPHLKSYASFVRDSVAGREHKTSQFRDFYDEYLSVLDMDEQFYIDSLQKIFWEHHIPTGRMTYQGELVDFGVIRDVPLLTVEGEKDNFCPVGQTRAAHDICVNLSDDKRAHLVQPGVGHYGVFSGSRFQNAIYPAIRDFALGRGALAVRDKAAA